MRIAGPDDELLSHCARKLWYFAHDLEMEENHENVEIGALIDQTSYVRDRKHIMIDDLINIGFIHNGRQLHEIKKSRKMEEADVIQIKYYLYYLKKRGVTDLTGRIDYPLLKKTLDVWLTDDEKSKALIIP